MPPVTIRVYRLFDGTVGLACTHCGHWFMAIGRGSVRECPAVLTRAQLTTALAAHECESP